MTNSILGAISRFWLEVNASAWRYCPDTVHRRLDAAYATFTREVRELAREQSDSDFGRGWREGHEVGRLDGLAQRDADAQRELALKNDQIQALMTTVESYRARLQEEPVARIVADDVEPQALRAIGQPRAPVH